MDHTEQGRKILAAFIALVLSAFALTTAPGCQAYQRPDGTTGTRLDETRVIAVKESVGTVGTAVAGTAHTIGVATGLPWLSDTAQAILGLLTLFGVGGASAAVAHGRGSRTGWNEARIEAGLPVSTAGTVLTTAKAA